MLNVGGGFPFVTMSPPVAWFLHVLFSVSHDVTAAMLVSQNKETAAMLVSRSNPPGIELYANVFFCFR